MNLPIVVGGGVAVLVLTYLFVANRRRRTLADVVVAPPNPATEEKALDWAPPEQSYADRRESVRRDGVPIRVVLSSAAFRNGVNDGFVVDRSTGGLKILMRTAMAPGGTVQVRAANAPDTIGFVTAIVRSCRPEGDHFIVGCEFEKTPPWNVLLLFG
ncbi:MAG TPA: PilZ domain-containing protein [Gemmataceae bacterium]|nr:PilZ domain-containing protein [Gemmataceae bacterium]